MDERKTINWLEIKLFLSNALIYWQSYFELTALTVGARPALVSDCICKASTDNTQEDSLYKMDATKVAELGKQLGLDGQNLLTFVSEREKARDEIEKLKIQVEKAKEEREQLRIQAERAKEETQQLRIQTEKAKEETEQFKMQAEKETTVEIEKLKMYAEREARTQLEQEKLKEEYEIAMEKIKQDVKRNNPKYDVFLMIIHQIYQFQR